MVTGSSEGTAKHWSVDSARCIGTLTYVVLNYTIMLIAAFSLPDGSMALTATDESLILWDLGSGTPIWYEPHLCLGWSRRLDSPSRCGRWLLGTKCPFGVGGTCLAGQTHLLAPHRVAPDSFIACPAMAGTGFEGRRAKVHWAKPTAWPGVAGARCLKGVRPGAFLEV